MLPQPLDKRQTGKTFVQNLQDMRLMRAEWLLLNTNQTVRTIAKSVGFSSDSYFTYVSAAGKGGLPLLLSVAFLILGSIKEGGRGA